MGEVVHKVKSQSILRWFGCGCCGLPTAMAGMRFSGSLSIAQEGFQGISFKYSLVLLI